MISNKTSAAALLKKSKLTGEDMGRAMIANFVYLMEHQELLFTQEDCEALRKKVSGSKDVDDLNNYITLSRWLTTAVTMADSHRKTLEQAIDKAKAIIRQESQQQQLYKYADSLPLIMTQKQYDKLEALGVDNQFSSNRNVFEIIAEAIDFLLEELEKHPRKANPLKTVVESYSHQLVTGHFIHKSYKAAWGKDFPQGLTKWELLTSCSLPMDEYYIIYTLGDDTPIKEKLAIYDEIYCNFQELIPQVAEYIDTKYKLGISNIPVCEWSSYSISRKKLYDKDFCGYRKLFSKDELVNAALVEDKEKEKAINNGIAILHTFDNAFKDKSLDDFEDPIKVFASFLLVGLAPYTEANKEQDQALQDLEMLVLLVKQELFYIQGFKMAIDMISRIHKLPLQCLYKDMVTQEAEVEKLRKAFATLYKIIQENNSSIDTYKEQKLAVLDSKLVDIGADLPERIEAYVDYVEKEIHNFGAFISSFDVITEYLCLSFKE